MAYTVDWLALLPILMVTGLGLVVMLLAAFVTRQAERIGYFSVAGLAATAAYVGAYWAGHPAGSSTSFAGAVTVDPFSLFFYLLLLMISAVAILTAIPYLSRENSQHGEYFAMIFFSLAGMFVLVSSNDLVTLFLGFEIMSLSVYVLTGWRRHAVRSNEAVLKYFFLGSVTAAIFLYGIAMLYGTVGSTSLVALQQQLLTGNPLAQPLLIIGLLLVLVAMAFKIAAFPFHMWTPDVYEGAPTPVTGFMATAVKAAGFALLMRFFVAAFGTGPLETMGYQILWVLAIATMFAGNIFALVQKNLKRMLAYSGIAHTGYLLVGVAALPDGDAGGAILFYLVAYAFTNLGALACVAFLQGKDERLVDIEDFAGVAWRYPLVGFGMAIFMFSLIGFPPTAGFFGKYYLFLASIKAGLMPLVVVAIINSILSVYYYLRVVIVMFMKPEVAVPTEETKVPSAVKLVVAYTAVAVVWAGIGTTNMTALLPGAAPLIESAKASAQALVAPPVPAAKR